MQLCECAQWIFKKSLTSFCIEQSSAGLLQSSRLQGCFGCLAKDALIMSREWPLVSDMQSSKSFDAFILLRKCNLDFLNKYLISLRLRGMRRIFAHKGIDPPAIIVSIEHDIRAIVCSSRRVVNFVNWQLYFDWNISTWNFLSVVKVASCLLLFPLWSSCIWILVLADAAWVN